jgi:hypothetical protein
LEVFALAVRNFVSHTSGTETIDGPKGQNNKMKRGGSVSANPIWEPATPSSPKQRFGSPKVNNQTGGYGENSPRTTPFNQHGPTGSIEPASPQPNLKGHNAAPHTKRP